ncbi:retroviral-like aspartic protease family protein [Phenylobacterium sp. J367]|uniref:retroviral-like aspartic protease family protein n=1 Tax=Phenylobacterium sp. J367 TaxID=2898435 RepID=UPI0021506E69|nr:retroviral-like aspartic protease family protein [Phenylobacterium sp. J367]MCR5880341.1 aspartyl protease family protein [Phenylobacterium sp. J367]
MSPTRRQAATGLFAAAGAALLPGRVRAEPQPVVEASDDPSAPPVSLDVQESKNEHLLAPVTINGQGPYHFLLDTGANASCVSARLMNDLLLPPGPPTRVHTVVGVKTRPSVMIDRLTVGARNRRRVRAPALPIRGADVDGVLGIDWLKGQRLTMDFKASSIAITSSRPDRPSEGTVVVPARRRLGQLTIVDADLSGERISAMIDSGAHVSLCNAPLRDLVMAAEIRRGRSEPPMAVELESLAGERFEGQLFFLPFLRLGGLHLGNVAVVYADMHVFKIWGLKDAPALVLGMDLLKQFDAVALDFGRSQVRFDMSEPKRLADMGRFGAGTRIRV